jgi:hemoglobin
MSTYALHHSALERRRVMLQKLGGEEKRREAIDRFYKKQMQDDRIMHFFDGTDVEIIKWHQFNLMSIAFTAVPANFDVTKLLLTRHQHLFDRGLNERHFDIVAHHFTDSLHEMGVDPALAREALEVVMPLRETFKQGAAAAKARKERAAFHSRVEKGIIAAIVAVFVMSHFRGRRP